MKDYIELSRNHFNKQAKEYDENTSTYFSGYAKISCEDITLYLENISYNNLLDVGCGTGWLLNKLSSNHVAKFYGIDISENMLQVAKDKNIPNTKLSLGSADKLPYKDNTFDVVTCVQSFHHYPQQDAAIEEAYRVLKEGGLYILSDTGIGGIGGWFDNNILFKIMKSGDCKTQNKKQVARKMNSHGFDIIRNDTLKPLIYTIVGIKL